MDWIECLDGSHVNKTRVIGVRIGTLGRSKEVFAVKVEIDRVTNAQSAFRDIFSGTREECEAYRDEFIGKPKAPAAAAKATGTKANGK